MARKMELLIIILNNLGHRKDKWLEILMFRLCSLFALDPPSENPVLLRKYSYPTLGHILLIQCLPILVQTFLLPSTVSTTVQFSSVQSLSRVRLFATPCTAALQASLSITNSRSSPKLMSVESVMPSNHLILCRPLLLLPSIFPSIRVFQMSQLFASSGQSIGISASTSVLPMNTQD